jgi:uncharacterized protein (DUF433 family)
VAVLARPEFISPGQIGAIAGRTRFGSPGVFPTVHSRDGVRREGKGCAVRHDIPANPCPGPRLSTSEPTTMYRTWLDYSVRWASVRPVLIGSTLAVRRLRPTIEEEDAVAALDRITRDPAVMGGRPCVRGMRVTVGMIVGQIGAGVTIEELLEAYPYLERDDILQALRYAAWLAEERGIPLATARRSYWT